MYFRDHPPPHFHARYGEYEITVEIETGIVDGRFPRRSLRAVLEWHELHHDELMRCWDMTQNRQPPGRIEPLE